MSDGQRRAEPRRSLRRVLVGTDLSSRADRALRRGALIAAAGAAELLVVHAVDDDQPRSLVEIERREAGALLREQVAGLAELRDRPATALSEEGDPFEVVLRIAEARDAGLVVLGEHRRRPLRDVFAGTTLERVMRYGDRPVLMVSEPVAGPYRQVLAATDLSEDSARALRAAARLGFLDAAALTVLHAFEPPGRGALKLADAPPAAIAAHEVEAAREAASGLAGFVSALELPRRPEQRVAAGQGHKGIRGTHAPRPPGRRHRRHRLPATGGAAQRRGRGSCRRAVRRLGCPAREARMTARPIEGVPPCRP